MKANEILYIVIVAAAFIALFGWVDCGACHSTLFGIAVIAAVVFILLELAKLLHVNQETPDAVRRK